MKNNKFIGALIFLITLAGESYSQANTQVEMADALHRDGKIYTVVFGLVFMLTVMIIFLIRIDRKLFRIEKNRKL